MAQDGSLAIMADETIPCLICERENSGEAILCVGCSAPLALRLDAEAQDRPPRIVSVIGESNVGKTVYLGFLLDMLSQRAGNFEAMPKGAYSIDLQQNVIAHMGNRRFPPKTAMEPDQWNWAYYQVRKANRQSKWVDLIMPDMAGEALAAEIDNPNTFKVIRQLLGKSSAMMLLVDAAMAADGAARPDFFALKILSYLDSIFATPRDKKLKIPIAVLLCKSDHCPESFDDPRRFVEANLNRLWNLCESRFANVNYFACSAVGSLAYSTALQDEPLDYTLQVPLHTSPHGILEPFEWIVDQM